MRRSRNDLGPRAENHNEGGADLSPLLNDIHDARDMVKIEGNNSKQVDRRDEREAKTSEDKTDRKDFKKLLEKKKGDSTQKQSGPDAAKKSLGNSPGKSPANKCAQSRRSGEFGERLRDGRQQLGEQSERRARVDTERHTSRQYDEKRIDGKHSERHRQDVDKGHATKQEQRTRPQRGKVQRGKAGGASGKSQVSGSGKPGVQAAEGQADNIAGLTGDHVGNQRAAGASSKAENVAPTPRSEKREQVAELAQKLVEKAHVGQDNAGRRIMLLDLQVPGRGNVRVRLRRRGEGFELRMRPENQELARDLRREREHFRQTASDGGVNFTSIEIV